MKKDAAKEEIDTSMERQREGNRQIHRQKDVDDKKPTDFKKRPEGQTKPTSTIFKNEKRNKNVKTIF